MFSPYIHTYLDFLSVDIKTCELHYRHAGMCKETFPDLGAEKLGDY